MAFKEIKEFRSNTTISLGGINGDTGKPNPTEIEGYFLGSRKGQNVNGEFVVHTFQTPKGNVDVWGKSKLNRLLSQATPGQMLRVVQEGTIKTKNGRMFDFAVYNDEENTIDVASLSTENSYDDSGEEEDEEIELPTGYGQTNYVAAKPSAELQKRTADVLAKGKAARTKN